MSNISFGAPQGALLGPILFIFYINNTYKSSDHVHFFQITDNTTIFESNCQINNVHDIVDREVVGVDNWLRVSRLQC